jgi:hypothetical protein
MANTVVKRIAELESALATEREAREQAEAERDMLRTVLRVVEDKSNGLIGYLSKFATVGRKGVGNDQQ